MLSKISPKAEVSSLAWVNPENVTIEEGVRIGPFSSIGVPSLAVEKEFILIGDNRLRTAEGSVIIHKNTFLGSHAHIALGVEKTGATVIGKNVVAGGNCSFGHDVNIGDNTILVSNVILNGHVKIGKNCWIGPGALISNRIEIGDEAKVSLGSVVTRNVERGKTVTGNFAIDHDKFIENLKKIR